LTLVSKRMLSKTLHRVTSCALVAAWLLASTAAGLWHAHPTGHDHATSCTHAGHAHHDHPSHSQRASAQRASAQSECWPTGAIQRTVSDHDDCVVCRFLAARVLPAAVVQLAAPGERIATLVAAEPIDLSAPLARTTHSRAPPAIG